MAKRVNDTCGPKGYESVSVRPIDNGYIVSRYSDDKHTETYSPTKPKIEIPKGEKPNGSVKATTRNRKY